MKEILENVDIEKELGEAFEKEKISRLRDGENNKKLTPAQKRDEIYKEIISIIENEDEDGLQTILIANPKLNFFGALPLLVEMKIAAVRNFNENIFNTLKNKSLNVPISLISDEIINGKENIKLFEYFCDIQNSTHGKDMQLNYINFEMIKIHLKETPKKNVEKLKKYRKIAIEKGLISNLGNSIIDYTYKIPEMAFNFREINQEFIDDINGACEVNINIITNKIMNKSSITGEGLLNLKTFLDTFPEIKEKIKSTYDKNKTLNQNNYEVINDLVSSGKKLNDTKLFNVIMEIANDEKNQKNSPQHLNHVFFTPPGSSIGNFNKEKLEEEFEFCFNRHSIKDELGFDTNDKIKTIGGIGQVTKGYAISQIINQMDDDIIIKMSHTYTPESMIENIIINASRSENVYEALLKNDKSRKLIHDKITNNPYIRYRWCENMTPAILSKTLRNVKELKSWHDSYGNNLGHYLVSFKHKPTKTYLQAVLRANRDWFYEKNNNGFDVMDIIKSPDGNNQKASITLLERDLLKHELKKDGLIKRRSKQNRKSRAM